jgi:hypothetical protein
MEKFASILALGTPRLLPGQITVPATLVLRGGVKADSRCLTHNLLQQIVRTTNFKRGRTNQVALAEFAGSILMRNFETCETSKHSCRTIPSRLCSASSFTRGPRAHSSLDATPPTRPPNRPPRRRCGTRASSGTWAASTTRCWRRRWGDGAAPFFRRSFVLAES